jgi:glycosyltransferase involved in cell wall biosynthesis|tara:strand:+ start:4051 stop:5163 length:1113 start_codon:yes stop_codon:yes gene_type:complete
MKILIYTGYHNPTLSKKRWLDEGIGGTEYCYIKLAEALVKQGHKVVVSGLVDARVDSGVHYIPLEQLKKHQSPLGKNNGDKLRGYDHYNIVIAGQYINYFKELKRKKITFDKSIFWLHNDDGWYNWYRGKVMKDDEVNEALSQVDKFVCVSEFHVDIIKDKLKAFGYTPHDSTTYIQSIDNAIDLDDWNNIKASKIKGRIIWSSAPDRGLKTILDNWSDLKQARPELTLTIACPPYASDWDAGLIKQDGIEYLGALSPKRLKEEQYKAEYWIYQSEYLETYCITGVEMMISNTKLLTNGGGNIKNIIGMGERGMLINNNPATIKEMLIRDTTDRTFARLWSNKTIVAREWAIKQTWNNRVTEWLSLIDTL